MLISITIPGFLPVYHAMKKAAEEHAAHVKPILLELKNLHFLLQEPGSEGRQDRRKNRGSPSNWLSRYNHQIWGKNNP